MKLRLLVLATAALVAAGCSDDNDNGGTGPGARMYNQVQRLGNPLVSELLLEKRDHAIHGSSGPDQTATRRFSSGSARAGAATGTAPFPTSWTRSRWIAPRPFASSASGSMSNAPPKTASVRNGPSEPSSPLLAVLPRGQPGPGAPSPPQSQQRLTTWHEARNHGGRTFPNFR